MYVNSNCVAHIRRIETHTHVNLTLQLNYEMIGSARYVERFLYFIFLISFLQNEEKTL